jgi:hypothetical protein
LASCLAVVAGAFSSLAGALLVGSAFLTALSSFFLASLTSSLAGAEATGAGAAGALAGSAAKADTAKAVDTSRAAIVFILVSFEVNEIYTATKLLSAYIYNATEVQSVDTVWMYFTRLYQFYALLY